MSFDLPQRPQETELRTTAEVCALDSQGGVSLRVAEDEAPVMQPTGFYVRSGKRYFDVVFSSTFLVCAASWLFPLIAIAIRLDSKGPVFFRQNRVGFGGQVFSCLKFRTMNHDPDAAFTQAAPNDPRVTRVGQVLRRHNLDELPQFINVLLGEMSVVGPRPHVPELDHLYGEQIKDYGARNLVKPGVTGLAQVSGRRGETRRLRDMAHRVRLDLFYVRRCSFLMDLRTILTTVHHSLVGDEKAY